MSSMKKYLGMLLATIMLAGTVGVVTARHRGGYHRRGGRGYYGGWGIGLGLGYPRYGYGWGYPGYYARPSFAKDNAGKDYWMVYNQSMHPIRVQTDRDETVIPAGALKKLYLRSSFNIRAYTTTMMRAINTRSHSIAVALDEAGRPYFKI